MAGTPRFKVHDADGKYVAAAIDAWIAVAIIGSVGHDGWKVKVDGRIVWREGSEVIPAGESYDTAAELIYERISAHHRAHYVRVSGGRTIEQEGVA